MANNTENRTFVPLGAKNGEIHLGFPKVVSTLGGVADMQLAFEQYVQVLEGFDLSHRDKLDGFSTFEIAIETRRRAGQLDSYRSSVVAQREALFDTALEVRATFSEALRNGGLFTNNGEYVPAQRMRDVLGEEQMADYANAGIVKTTLGQLAKDTGKDPGDLAIGLGLGKGVPEGRELVIFGKDSHERFAFVGGQGSLPGIRVASFAFVPDGKIGLGYVLEQSTFDFTGRNPLGEYAAKRLAANGLPDRRESLIPLSTIVIAALYDIYREGPIARTSEFYEMFTSPGRRTYGRRVDVHWYRHDNRFQVAE